MSWFISFLRALNGIKALIEYDKEVTKVAKEWYHGNTQYIKLDYDSSLKLKCTMVPVVPHVKGNWHTCRWTERIGEMIKREWPTEYLVNFDAQINEIFLIFDSLIYSWDCTSIWELTGLIGHVHSMNVKKKIVFQAMVVQLKRRLMYM